MSEFLDELARTLATPMPRRRALRTLGGALVAVAVPGSLRVSTASAHTFTPSTKVGVCEKNCTDPFPVTCLCKTGGVGCFETCGVRGATCCCLKGADGRTGAIVACPPGYRCGSPPRTSNCVCVDPCGAACCGQDRFCANPRQGLCCKEGERGCGLECCDPNEECRKARVGTGSLDTCVKRCPQGQAWCGRDKCCPPKWRCVNERTGLCKRCGRNEEECENKKCCDKSTGRCCGKAGCCPKNRSCCVTGKKQVCCPPRQKCAVPILPGDIGIKPGTEAICCPPERYRDNPKLCCPAGQVALRGPGIRVGPGLSPFCCPRGQTCGSGANLTCCQRGATGTESCCNGKCVDLQFDAANCGSCGNICASGVCSRGICALP